MVFAVGGVAGGLLAGRLGDRVIHTRRERPAPGRRGDCRRRSARSVIWASARASVYAAIALIAVAYGTLNAYYGLVYSAIQDIVAPAMRGTAMAIYFMAMYLCGASFGPLLTGQLSDLMARRAADAAGAARITEAFKAIGLQQAMFIIPVLSLLLALVLYCGSRTIAADMRKRAAQPDRGALCRLKTSRRSIGKRGRVSDWLTVTQELIDEFAEPHRRPAVDSRRSRTRAPRIAVRRHRGARVPDGGAVEQAGQPGGGPRRRTPNCA